MSHERNLQVLATKTHLKVLVTVSLLWKIWRLFHYCGKYEDTSFNLFYDTCIIFVNHLQQRRRRRRRRRCRSCQTVTKFFMSSLLSYVWPFKIWNNTLNLQCISPKSPRLSRWNKTMQSYGRPPLLSGSICNSHLWLRVRIPSTTAMLFSI